MEYIFKEVVMKLVKKRSVKLDREIFSVVENLRTMDPASEEYTTTCENLKTLYECRSEKKRTFAEMMKIGMQVAGSLAGIGLIIWFEKTDVLNTKALGQIFKSGR
jgi:hypothetical protein